MSSSITESNSTYIGNRPIFSNETVCSAPAATYTEAELLQKFTNGVATDTLVPDASTGRINTDQLDTYIRSITSTSENAIIKERPVTKVGTAQETDIKQLMIDDEALYNKLHQEYCYYEQRYKYAFKQFLLRATSGIASDSTIANTMLSHAKTLNLRLNSLLEIINRLAQYRVSEVNVHTAAINTQNTAINNRLSELQSSYTLLNSDKAIIKTQEEMVRYTQEKNNYTSNQIAVWSTMNIIALGVIFYVYRN